MRSAVTGEFDGSSSVSGDSEVFLTGHEINEIPAEKNRFELNLETIFVDASSSHTPPADEEVVSSEYDDTQYSMNTDPGGSIWGAAASGFVSGFFSRQNLSTAVGLVPILGTVQSAVELATGYDYIGGEEADRRHAAVGLVPGGKGIANGAKGIINAAAPLARQTTILGTAPGAANALRKSAPVSGVAGTRGLQHSFDSHSAQWFSRHGGTASLSKWQELIETAARSSNVVDWSTGADKTIGRLARIDGNKWFFVQFFKEGPRAGEVATAFIPNTSQLRAILELLGK